MRRIAPILALALALAVAGGVAQTASGVSSPVTRDVRASDNQTSWSPDGRWIAYVGDSFYGRKLLLAAADGSGVRVIDDAQLAPRATWSPDGRRILWTTFYGAQVLDVVSGVRHRPGGTNYFDWAPDGERLLYGVPYGGAALHVSRWDGTGAGVLASRAWDATWAPDGAEIAFVEGLACQPRGIELVRPDGTGRRTIAPDAIGPGVLSWSPSGEQIAYRSSCGQELYVVQRDGTGHRGLGERSSYYGPPKWSPRGRWLGVATGAAILMMDVEGPSRVRITRQTNVQGAGVSWSPSGNEVTYESKGRVYVASTAGWERDVLEGRGPDWSPDGQWLSFVRSPYQTRMPFLHCREQLFVARVDGSGARPVTPCTIYGSFRGDRIVGTLAADTAFASSGGDRMYGAAGDDRLHGQRGSDRLYGGEGADYLDGGAGSDRIGARDGRVDTVRCGPGQDVAVVDTADIVGTDCEGVLRR